MASAGCLWPVGNIWDSLSSGEAMRGKTVCRVSGRRVLVHQGQLATPSQDSRQCPVRYGDGECDLNIRGK